MNDVDECLIQDGDNGCKEAERAIRQICEELKTSPAIAQALDDMADFLVAQNTRYANSVFEPIRMFTSASVETLIRVRMNDKVARIMRGQLAGEDAFKDLLGYHILHQAFPIYQELIAARTVPGPIVTESLKNRGLRIGMTYQEVRANRWTMCKGRHTDENWKLLPCSEGDPCSACKFLDGALCECGEPFPLHSSGGCGHRDGDAFSLASWPNESLEPSVVFLGTSPDIQELPGIPSQPDDVIAMPVGREPLIVEVPTLLSRVNDQLSTDPKKEPTMTDTKKPRIDRKTWHETSAGIAALMLVRDALESKPPRSYFAREIAPMTGLDLSVVGLALDRLILTGYAAQHGKAKGTRYAHAGFTAWPAPLPRKASASVALTPAGVAFSDAPPVSASDIAPYTREGMNETDAADSET